MHDFLECAEHVLRADELLPVLNSLVDGLIDEGFDIRPAPVLAALGELIYEVFADVVELAYLFVEDGLEDALALLLIGKGNEYFEVESAGSEDRVVYEIDSVGCADDQHFIVGIEAVHLAEELVNCCGCFVGISEVVEPASQGVDLVHEDDAAVLAAPCTRE